MHRGLKILVGVGLTMWLSACSQGEPSADEISSTLANALSREMEQFQRLAGGDGNPFAKQAADMFDIKISNFEKIGCQETGKSAYSCNISFTASGGILGARGESRAGPVNMIRTSDGWALTR